MSEPKMTVTLSDARAFVASLKRAGFDTDDLARIRAASTRLGRRRSIAVPGISVNGGLIWEALYEDANPSEKTEVA